MLKPSDLFGLYLVGSLLKDKHYYCPKCGLEVTPHQHECFHCHCRFISGAAIAAKQSEKLWRGFTVVLVIAVFGIGGILLVATRTSVPGKPTVHYHEVEPNAQAPAATRQATSKPVARFDPFAPAIQTLPKQDETPAITLEPERPEQDDTPAITLEPERQPKESPSAVRTWTDKKNNTFHGTWQGMVAGNVRIRTPEGKMLTIPRDEFSVEDQEWIRNRISAAKDEYRDRIRER